jgi:formate hydrogenlyase subunit 3/multisubunit Na+/H+ antiporter MnhD subunit
MCQKMKHNVIYQAVKSSTNIYHTAAQLVLVVVSFFCLVGRNRIYAACTSRKEDRHKQFFSTSVVVLLYLSIQYFTFRSLVSYFCWQETNQCCFPVPLTLFLQKVSQNNEQQIHLVLDVVVSLVGRNRISMHAPKDDTPVIYHTVAQNILTQHHHS